MKKVFNNIDNHSIFFKWLWLFCLIFSGVGYGFVLGVFQKIYYYDISHLTLVIYAIFICVTLKIGWFTWRIDKIKNKEKESNELVEMISVWGMRLQYLGICGTVYGLGIIFQNLGSAEKLDILSQSGTTIFNILVSTGTFLLLDIQSRHVYISIKNEFFK